MISSSQRQHRGPEEPGRGATPRDIVDATAREREDRELNASAPAPGVRSRSYCFLEREGRSYTVFLVTYPAGPRQWRGYFVFRAAGGDGSGLEVRTADLFMEPSEREIDERARGLGRPLIQALLESALHTHERNALAAESARKSLRDILTRRAAELAADEPAEPEQQLSLGRLRSLYESYRLDQVAHLIALIAPEDFRALVTRLLEGRKIDFRSRDRYQLAMLVVQEIERHLPLPPFEHWVGDYLAHREAYRQYAHALHREAVLP